MTIHEFTEFPRTEIIPDFYKKYISDSNECLESKSYPDMMKVVINSINKKGENLSAKYSYSELYTPELGLARRLPEETYPKVYLAPEKMRRSETPKSLVIDPTRLVGPNGSSFATGKYLEPNYYMSGSAIISSGFTFPVFDTKPKIEQPQFYNEKEFSLLTEYIEEKEKVRLEQEAKLEEQRKIAQSEFIEKERIKEEQRAAEMLLKKKKDARDKMLNDLKDPKNEMFDPLTAFKYEAGIYELGEFC